MCAFAFELAVVMLTAALIGIMYHEDFYRGPIPPEAQAACPEHLKELCRMPINDHIMPRANVAVLGISLIGCMVSLDVFGADVAVARRYQSPRCCRTPSAASVSTPRSSRCRRCVLDHLPALRRRRRPSPRTTVVVRRHGRPRLGYFGPSRSRVRSRRSAPSSSYCPRSSSLCAAALPELRRAGDFIYEVATSSSYIRWALEAAHIQEAVYHQRSYDVSGGMEFFGMVMGTAHLAWIFAIGAVFRVATYAALLARQPASSGGRARSAAGCAPRSPPAAAPPRDTSSWRGGGLGGTARPERGRRRWSTCKAGEHKIRLREHAA